MGESDYVQPITTYSPAPPISRPFYVPVMSSRLCGHCCTLKKTGLRTDQFNGRESKKGVHFRSSVLNPDKKNLLKLPLFMQFWPMSERVVESGSRQKGELLLEYRERMSSDYQSNWIRVVKS